MEEQPFRGQESTETFTSEVGSVTIQESRVDPKLHFCIKETDKCIQIGECCTYVEISINGPYMERMMLQGQLSGELRSSSGEKIISIYWSDLVQVDDKMHYINQLKLELDNIEQEEKDNITLQILRDAIDNYTKKVRKIVEKIIRIDGRLVGIASGCLELTVVHKSKESANKLTSPETLKEVEDFLNKLLITDKIRQVSGNVHLSARLLITKEVDSSKVMEYCFTPDKYKSEKSEIQAAVQVMKAHTTEKQKETLALVEDRLKVATEEISQRFEQQLDAVKGQILTMGNEIIKVVSRLQEPKASVESTGLPSSSVSEDESTRSQTSIPVEISQTSIPVEVSQASMTVEGVQTPSQASLSLSDPAPSQASLSVSDPAPSQASMSVSDPAPSQASLSVSDPAPSQASLSVSDPAPSQASMSMSDPAPSQASMSHSVRSGLRFDEPEDIDIEELASRSKARPFFSRKITAPTSEAVSDDSIQHDERKELYDEEKTILIPDVEVKDRLTDCFQNIEKFLQFLLGDEEDRGKEKSDTPKAEMEKVTTTGPGAYEKGETKGILEGLIGRDEAQNIKFYIKKLKSDLKNLPEAEGDKMAVDAIVVIHEYHYYKELGWNITKDLQKNLSSKETVAVIVLGGEESMVSKPSVGSWKDVLDIIYKMQSYREKWPRVPGNQWNLIGLLVGLYIILHTGRVVHIGRHYTVLPKILMQVWQEKSSPILHEITNLMTYFNLHPAIFQPWRIPSAEVYKYFTLEKNKTEFINFLFVETAVGKIVSYIKEPEDDDKDHKTSFMEIMKQRAWSSLFPKGITVEDSYLERRIVSALDTLPELGTRVRWKVPMSYEGEVRGTVVKHMYPDLLLVIFDDGAEQYFTWSFEQTYLTFSVPTKASKEQLPVGTLVQRGKVWKFGDQDGGEDEIGVVIRGDKIKDGELVRRVCWRSSAAVKKINMYRYGDQGKYDIKPLEHLHEVDPGILPTDSDKVRQWQVLDEKGQAVIIPKKLMWSLQQQRTVVTLLRDQQVKTTWTEKGLQIKNLEDDSEYTWTV